MIASGDLRPGMTFLIDSNIFVCMEASHNKTARAAANIKVKMKNLRSGAITSETFGPGDKFEPAPIEKVKMQYLYNQGDEIVFMNNETYDQFEIPVKLLEWELNFIVPESICTMRMYNGEVLGVELAPSVVLTVTEAEPGIKGNTATSITVRAQVETGYELQVPQFISTGDKIEISTADGSYKGRG